MEKNFAMLRVTEEKERNFEKRGYMGKKVLGITYNITVLYRLSEYGK